MAQEIRKRGSDRDLEELASQAEIVRVAVEAETAQHKPKKVLKLARSQAELTALRQRQIQICLVATNVLISALIALKTFGII